jgi:SpoIID/LytB domain protein
MSKLRPFLWLLFLLLILIATAKLIPTPDEKGDIYNPKIEVTLQSISPQDSLSLEIDGRYQVLDGETREVILQREQFRGSITCDFTGPKLGPYLTNRSHVVIKAQGDRAIRLNYFTYSGELSIKAFFNSHRTPTKLEFSLTLDLEDYVLGVVCGELPSQSPGIQSALEAQAISARTYALWKLSLGKSLRDDSRDQVFQGTDYITKEAKEAVANTRGEVLTFNEAIFPTYFHRNCGGQCAQAIKTGFYQEDIPPLKGSKEPECSNIYERWTKEVKADSLDKLAQEFNLGTYLKAMHTIQKDDNGRRNKIRLQGDESHYDVHGEFVRARLGVPSMIWHSIMMQPDGAMTVTGSGYGHGIGLCQEGAMRRARNGLTKTDILSHYYPDGKVVTLSSDLMP